ncbi:uncharacterized protein METZ01_LOCUS236598, partial [marine metagenome]
MTNLDEGRQNSVGPVLRAGEVA